MFDQFGAGIVRLNRWSHKMLKQYAHLIAPLLCLLAVSCGPEPESLPIKTPEGLQTLTETQPELAQDIRRLTRGMTKEQVKEILGRPIDETQDLLLYFLIEGASGGNYISDQLRFDRQGLASAELGFGHISLEFEMEP